MLKLPVIIGAVRSTFVIDTGAAVSVVPKRLVNGVTITHTPISLSTATGSAIRCYGEANLELNIPCLKRVFNWNFVVADIMQPLIGMDFLSNFMISVDCSNRSIKDY